MKKIFNNPEIEIMILANEDVITTSDASGAWDEETATGVNETPDW
jgi:hypothetical protein